MFKYIMNIQFTNYENDNMEKLWKLFDTIEEEESVSMEEMDTKTTESDMSIEETDSENYININIDNKCKECNEVDTIINDHKEGISVCTECGYVYENILDYSPVWTTDKNNTQSMCGIKTNYYLPKSSLGTSISGSKYNKLKRLQSWGAMPYRERSLYIVLKDITQRCTKHNIKKNIIDDAKFMYKKISECKHKSGKNKGKYKIIRGSNRRSLIAACVFYACKMNGNTRSPKEIAKIFDLKITEITKGCKKFVDHMEDYKSVNNRKIYKLKSSTPSHFVKRYCNLLQVHDIYIEKAIIIAKNVDKLGLASDHTPPSVAVGSILLMSKINNLDLTKKIISKKFNISEVTISKIYKKIKQYQNIIINTEETDKLVKLINSQ